MQAARLANKVPQVEVSSSSNGFKALGDVRGPGPSRRFHGDEIHTSGGYNYPFMEAEADDSTVKYVERLLRVYKDVVSKYSSSEKGLPGSPGTANDDLEKGLPGSPRSANDDIKKESAGS
ncbi:hypothetical protein Pint_07002 [Pistacia integerrima]|uniref:Uncharacterized protein n=1 Tax=Pistacia integerrima TaxID=434235 RepID=A0ACC0XVS5_9ROSI|nr:hypothetical protein Pint_07002 [Pistacia integerrima]